MDQPVEIFPQESQNGNGRLGARYLMAAVAVGIIAFVVFLPVIQNDFVNWDDYEYVQDNTNIHGIKPSLFRWAFTTFSNCNWHPLTWLSFALDYEVWGNDPFGYHVSTLILHACVSALVVILTFRLISVFRGSTNGNLFPAVAAGILFGIHPLHVESVAWITERKDVLCAFFYVSGLLAYTYTISDQGKRRLPLLSITCFTLALLAKPMAVSLPLVLIIIDLVYTRSPVWTTLRRSVVQKAPYIVLSCVSSMLTIIAQRSGGALRTVTELSFLERTASAIEAYGFYLFKLAVPVALSPFYPHRDYTKTGFAYPMLAAILLLIITLSCFSLWRQGKRYWLGAWLFFLITLLPVIGIVQVGDQFAADRYMYIPSISFFIVTGLIVNRLFTLSAGSRGKKAALSAVLALLLCALVLQSRFQITIWKNSVSLWSRAISINAEGASLPYLGRGMAYLDVRDYPNALKDCQHAFALNPRNPANSTCVMEAAFYLRRYALASDMLNYRKSLEGAGSSVTRRN